MKRFFKYILYTPLTLFFFLKGVDAQKINNQPNKPVVNSIKETIEEPVYKAGIRVLAKSYTDSIVLRWAPNTAWAWNSLNKVGYIVERFDISDPKRPKRQILNPSPIKPFTLEQFKQHFDRNNKYAAAAAQCLYGKNFTNNLRNNYGGIQDQSSAFSDRFGFSLMVADFDAGVATAQALRFTDKNVQKGAVYIYKVYPAAPTSPAKVDTGGAFVVNDGKLSAAKPVLTEIIGRDRTGELHWNRYQKELYSGYLIERSENGSEFRPVNKDPFFASMPDSMMAKKDTSLRRLYGLLKLQQVFIDSLPRNYVKYSYRIKGINAFAEWSKYSDTLMVQGRDLTPPAPVSMVNPKFIGGKKILLQWKKKIKEPDFKGYAVSRSHNNVNGPYIVLNDRLLDPSVTQYADTAAYIHGENFYMVVAVDTAGNLGASAPAMGLVPDKTAPSTPSGLKGFIEKNGRVHLTWNQNTEEDMKGYKVYYANSPDHVFSQITEYAISDTSFVDSISLKNLTKNIWYKIVAVDQNNNHSEFSMASKLRKPDIVPPVPPLVFKVLVDSGGVHIDWIKSSSTDVVHYIIFRKEKNTDWINLQTIPHDSTKSRFKYTDSSSRPFVEYLYAAESVDEDSLHSAKSTPVKASVKTIPDRQSVKTLTANYDQKQKIIQLKWQFRENGEYFFLIYKAGKTGELAKFRSVDASINEYNDHIPPGQSGDLHYAIQVVFKDQRGKTRLSDPVTVPIK